MSIAIQTSWLARLVSCVLIVGGVAHKGAGQPTSLPAAIPLAPDELFKLTSPAVVKIIIKDDDDREIASASAFVVDSGRGAAREDSLALYETIVVTNYHVVYPAVSAEIIFEDESVGLVDKLIAGDEAADLAILSVSSLHKPARLRALSVPTDHLVPPVGTKVYAIGSPRGLSNTLSEGIVSGHRDRGDGRRWIQLTAPISPGSSGGPLVSNVGTFLGVATASIEGGQNLNFAVPAEDVRRLLDSPKGDRYLWEGASLKKTEKVAFISAQGAFYARFYRMRDRKTPEGGRAEAFNEFCTDQEVAGDQLALLLKGYEQCDTESMWPCMEDLEAAVATLRRATESEPCDFAYLAYLRLDAVCTWVALHKDFSAAKIAPPSEVLQRARDLKPDFGPTWNTICCRHENASQWPELLVAAERLVQLMPRCYRGYKYRGRAWAELGRMKAFEEDFNRAEQLNPRDCRLYCEKGNVYLSLREPAKAVQSLKRSIELDSDYALAHGLLGDAYQRLGLYKQGLDSFQEARRLWGPDGPFEEALLGYIAECRQKIAIAP